MSARTAAVLDEAANIIERNGLHKGSFGANHGRNIGREQPCCAYGAINLAAGGDSPRRWSLTGEAAYDAVTRHLGLSDGPGDCLADWSDHPGRTAGEVVAALRGAARAEREAAS